MRKLKRYIGAVRVVIAFALNCYVAEGANWLAGKVAPPGLDFQGQLDVFGEYPFPYYTKGKRLSRD
jgi:hypothetical protein